MSGPGVLAGFTVMSLALNVPGPLAAAALRDAGARVVKGEPPAGDPLASMSAAWYADLHRGVEVRTLDLKSEVARAEFAELLAGADLLLTSSRPSALDRLDLSPAALDAAFPGLCRVRIVGDTRAPEVPGHDLTYQAEAGMLDPRSPVMPRTLLADVLGGREAFGAALTLLLGRERGSGMRERVVGLGDAARFAAQPLHYGLTAPGGLLSGARENYRLYQTADGWVAAAPLEAHFAERWSDVLGADPADTLASRPTAHWLEVAAREDLPLAAIGDGRTQQTAGES